MVAVLVLVLALVAPDLASRQAPRAPLATLASGTVQGSWSSSRAGRLIASYQGIPYAAPPLGQLRFKTPRPPLSWSGVLNATAPGPECPQRPFLSKKRQIVGDEDCLFINVHTPEHAGPDTQLDVLVFIHGGAYSQRSGADFKPKYLLDHDVVLVTFNYRLGPLGFLSTQDEIIPGNAGLKDQVLALRWVQHNIAAFGGNRNNVLVFGESAGASSVELLMMSPLAKGLFHRAALQSGSVLCPWAFSPPGEPLHYAARLAEVLQCPAEPSSALRDCLLTRSAQDIMAVEYDLLEFGILPVSMFKPVVEVAGAEGAFLTRHPEELLASGLQSDVPLMIGVNSHEGGLWAVGEHPLKCSHVHWENVVRK